jgi:ABC-2 type transport system ATP-binding protein
MISVQGLTKSFGTTEAVRNLTFRVDRGEIVGFLGPNGAGKSTTMKIICGYLPPDSGEVEIAGFNVFSNSLQARSRIGYLPENVPLYPEMRVGEYLSYRAALKGVRARRIPEKVEDALELCNISQVKSQLIGTLSKGYRQRVGLADALVNEPDILILDEPTIGLDPGQIREVRELIKGLATRHTILLSSHILSEVEMTCSRVLILNKGSIAASGTPTQLRQHAGIPLAGAVRFEVAMANDEASMAMLHELKSILPKDDVSLKECTGGWATYTITPFIEDPRVTLFEMAVRRGWKVRELSASQLTLEEIFTSFVRQPERESDERIGGNQ